MGIVYRGFDPTTLQPCFKFKSINRDAEGKRPPRFLFGNGDGGMFLNGIPGAPLIVAGGEEKTAAAHAAGFSAIGQLAGEKRLSKAWIKAILRDYADRDVIFANDHDDAGEKANLDSARALQDAGFDPCKIRRVKWPEGSPNKCDLNDVLKASGLEAVRRTRRVPF